MKDISYIINQLGEERDKYFNAVTPPIFQTSNFAFSNVEDLRQSLHDERHSMLYSRGNNPTIDILCKKLAALEDTEESLALHSKRHPQYELALKQMNKPAGLFSIRLAVKERAKTEMFVNSLRQFIIGVSWGGHESLVFPALAFDEKCTKEGYSNNLIRFYIGLDEPEALIRDLNQAFEKIRKS